MNTTAGAAAGETSLADVDSIDTPPRAIPETSSSPTPQSLVDAKPHANSLSQPPLTELEDIFSSSRSTSPLASDTKGDVHREAAEGINNSRVSTNLFSQQQPASRATMGTAARIPRKENLYTRRRSGASSRSASLPQSDPVSRRHPTLTAAEAAEGSLSPHGTMNTSVHTQALAERYGKERESITTADEEPQRLGASSGQGFSTAPATLFVEMDGESDVSTDTLRRRMQHKEQEFDQKIYEIHHTFQNAGEQLLVRDHIIARLQDELAQLRRESARVPAAYQTREEKLLGKLEETMHALHDEQQRSKSFRRTSEEETRRLRAALAESDQQLAAQQHTADDLLRQLRASDRAVQQEKQRQDGLVEETQRLYESKLADLQRTMLSLKNDIARAEGRNAELDSNLRMSQAKMLDMELGGRRQRTAEAVSTRELAAEKVALSEEVEAVRLSIARLLHLMARVPALADYLHWNELSSEFVFLGYPTRYFASGPEASPGPRSHSTRSGGGLVGKRADQGRSGPVRRSAFAGSRQRSRTASPSRLRTDTTALSGDEYGGVEHNSIGDASSSAGGGYYQDAVNVTGGSQRDTGVDDGVYAGIEAALSKNVWLSGRWAKEMLAIITAENSFTRLKRIKLLEMEEAAQLSEQLPSARDVLECRQPEHHYWIPYAVFTEAQKFKNKYYPKLPAMSHFFPFLIQLNKIWRTKLQDRLRVAQRPSSTREVAPSVRSPHTSYLNEESECVSGMSGLSATTTTTSAATRPHSTCPESVPHRLVQCESRASEIREEHHRLRREIRLHVSSPKNLQFFHCYDELVRVAQGNVKEALLVAESLCHGAMTPRTETAEAQRRRTANNLHDIQAQAQASAEAAAAQDARDQLLSLVAQTAERMCAVADTLSTETMSYYSDLHQLIHILHRQVRQQRTRDLGKDSYDGDMDRRELSYMGGDAVSSAALRSRLQSLLHERYGGGNGGAVSPGTDGTPAGTSFLAQPDTQSVDSLLKLAASVLDFGDEVRTEVTRASSSLHAIARQAMQEADQLHDDYA